MKMKPVPRHIANLWTLMGHPGRQNEWSLDEKLSAMATPFLENGRNVYDHSADLAESYGPFPGKTKGTA
jgi:hypothetical protein